MTGTILVTGAGGFLGRHVVTALAAAGNEVIQCVRNMRADMGEVRVLECDLQFPAQVLALESRCRPAAVVHLASDVTLTTNDDSSLFVPNVLATACIAHLARRWDAHLIFASSVTVHGIKAMQIDPAAPLNTDTAYARSKLLGEQVIQASGVRCCVLRIAGIFGRNGPNHLGVNRAIDAALAGAAPSVAGSGGAKRNYIYVKYAANAVVEAVERKLEGIHHLAGSEVISIREMMQSICETLLGGATPSFTSSADAFDQLVAPSPTLPVTRSFVAALRDLQSARSS